MTIAARIRVVRQKLLDLTLEKFGDKVGVSPQAVWQWENNVTEPTTGNAKKIARLAKVPLLWLIEGPGNTPPKESFQTVFESLNDADRAVIEALADTLKRRSEQEEAS